MLIINHLWQSHGWDCDGGCPGVFMPFGMAIRD
nr:MAG TPA: glycoside hydrolase family protein [Caudoviricetes sp.]